MQTKKLTLPRHCFSEALEPHSRWNVMTRWQNNTFPAEGDGRIAWWHSRIRDIRNWTTLVSPSLALVSLARFVFRMPMYFSNDEANSSFPLSTSFEQRHAMMCVGKRNSDFVRVGWKAQTKPSGAFLEHITCKRCCYVTAIIPSRY